MRKLFNTMLALLIILLIYQFFVTFLINKRDYNYSLITKDNDYSIKEKYNRKKGISMYSFLITDKNKNNFVYSYKGDLNRQSRVLKDIVSYNSNGLHCIAPVFKNDSIESIVCKYENQLVSYTYLKQIGNTEVDSFINNLSSTGYKINLDYKDINSAKTAHGNAGGHGHPVL